MILSFNKCVYEETYQAKNKSLEIQAVSRNYQLGVHNTDDFELSLQKSGRIMSASPKIQLTARTRRIPGDLLTPVGIYLRLRDRFPNCFLLESADFQPNESCSSYICIDPVAEFKIDGQGWSESYPDGRSNRGTLQSNAEGIERFKKYLNCFKIESVANPALANGLFGYMSYDAVQYCEDIILNSPAAETHIPEFRYHAFRYIIAVNHYRHEMFLTENIYSGDVRKAEFSGDDLIHFINRSPLPEYSFHLQGAEKSNFSDDEHRTLVDRCKQHVFRGDVFQIVLSRRFSQPYSGDDFQVYRALRSINPSPYLFYFDYGDYRIIGSSPEAELLVEGQTALIKPIAGTCKRSGSKEADAESVNHLLKDPKENAEHVMLVDLARNDLSKHCTNVRVESFREVQYFSHVIHLVSSVAGQMSKQTDAVQLLADTFPAGTLSGAPKYRAMQLIDQYEGSRRSFYGGALGFLGFDGGCTHAIMIRTLLSKNGVLYSQAGGGLVSDSEPENEVQEVHNKRGALKAAIKAASEMEW